MSEHFEPEIESLKEIDWSQAEAIIETRLALMEPEARLILKSIRAHECQESFEALVEFFGTVELVEDEMTFESALKVIDTVYDAFDKIDVDHDHVLTREELEKYSRELDADSEKELEKADGSDRIDRLEKPDKHSLAWLIKNFETLQFANLTRRSRGISKKDLLEAGSVFHGLKLVQENFKAVSVKDKKGEREVTTASLFRYLKKKGHRLSLRDRMALKHLAFYVARLARRDIEHEGLTWDKLVHLEPGELWGK